MPVKQYISGTAPSQGNGGEAVRCTTCSYSSTPAVQQYSDRENDNEDAHTCELGDEPDQAQQEGSPPVNKSEEIAKANVRQVGTAQVR